jgi:methylated-DNA-[protein]-cysteine S-methyltransferase
MQEPATSISHYHSPLGLIAITAGKDAIYSVLFIGKDPVQTGAATQAAETSPVESALALECRRQLEEYFAGKRKSFDLPLHFSGSSFQNRVWYQLQQIPFGSTISYLQLAKNLGDVKSIRAAGSANGKNLFAVIVPCHRVVGSNSDLVGYAGGLWRKRWLLQHESNQHAIAF